MYHHLTSPYLRRIWFAAPQDESDKQVDWLASVSSDINQPYEVLPLTLRLMDISLSLAINFDKKNAQLLAACCLWIACKLVGSTICVTAVDLASYMDNQYTVQEMLAMEAYVISVLGRRMQPPTVYHFLRLYIHSFVHAINPTGPAATSTQAGTGSSSSSSAAAKTEEGGDTQELPSSQEQALKERDKPFSECAHFLMLACLHDGLLSAVCPSLLAGAILASTIESVYGVDAFSMSYFHYATNGYFFDAKNRSICMELMTMIMSAARVCQESPQCLYMRKQCPSFFRRKFYPGLMSPSGQSFVCDTVLQCTVEEPDPGLEMVRRMQAALGVICPVRPLLCWLDI